MLHDVPRAMRCRDFSCKANDKQCLALYLGFHKLSEMVCPYLHQHPPPIDHHGRPGHFVALFRSPQARVASAYNHFVIGGLDKEEKSRGLT